MEDKLKKKFAVILATIAAISGILMAMSASGRDMILSDAAGLIITPLQKFTTTLGKSFGNFTGYFTMFDELKAENERLKEENRELINDTVELDTYRIENQRLKEMLGIIENYPDFEIELAQVIATEASNWFTTLVLDKGSLAGIQKRDTVMTSDGLVGIVTETGPTWCKVATILEANKISIGAISTRTKDVGIIEGGLELRMEGLCKFGYISKDATIASGDYVETSGLGEIFPAGILIGKIQSVALEPHGVSQYALIEPAVEFENLKEVMIIKDFYGKLNISSEGQ